MFTQLLFNGIIAGAIYALAAVGFSIIYSTCKFVHFAHGVIIIFSGYILYWLFTVSGINFWLAAILSIIFAAALGGACNFLVYRPLRTKKASTSTLLIASVGLMILLEALIFLFFGANTKIVNFITTVKSFHIFGAMITPLQLFIILVAIILFFLTYLLMKKTKIGKAMRAVADNKDVAEIVGISSERIYTWSFVIGSALAGVAGILIALEQNLDPGMGTGLMIKVFAAAIIGGIGSVPGAILGAFFLGLAENFGIWYLPSGYKDAIAFLILFIFLIFWPKGLISIKKGKTR